MTTYTWKNSVSGDWNTTADWTPAGRPNADTADALIDSSGTYTVSIGRNETFTANQVTLDAAGATLSLASGSSLTLAGTAAALVLNAGTFDLTGLLQGGTVEVDGATTQFGTPSQLGGTLEGVTWLGPLTFGLGEDLTVIDGLTVKTAAGSSPGTIDMSAGGDMLSLTTGETLDSATLNFSGDGDYLVDATTGGTLTLGGGFTLDSSGINNWLFNDESDNTTTSTMINAGLINVSGGTLTNSYGNLVNTGTIALSGGTLQFSEPFGIGAQAVGITNSGSITIGAGGVLNLSSDSGPSGPLTNSGSITIGTGGTLAASDITANTGQITVASGGLLSVGVFDADSGVVAIADGGTFSALYFDSSTPFTNYGLVEADGHFAADGITIASGATLIGAKTVVGTITAISTVTVIGAVTDTGVVEANSGVLQLESAVAGNGVLQIDAGAGLQLDVSDSTNVDFAAGSGTLVLGQAGGFTGTIDGFTIGDTIDMPNVAFDPSGTATMLAGNTLQVVANASTYDLKFDPSQSFTGDFFHLTPDGSAIIENTVPPYYTWTTAISGDWAMGADWTPAGPPDAATANAVIDAIGSYTVTITSGESFLANALTLAAAGATVSVAGTLTLNEIISDGLINIVGGTADLSQGTLNNAGVITIGSNGTLGGELILNAVTANSGGIAIAAGGTLDLQGTQTLSGDIVAGLGKVTSTGGLLLVGGSLDLGGGTLDLAATGPLSEFGVAGTLANGTVDADAGAILLGNGVILSDVTWQGTLTISGTELVIGVAGGYGINLAGGSLTNDGVIFGGGAAYASAGATGVTATGSRLTNDDDGAIFGGAGSNAYYGGAGGNGVTATGSTLTNNGMLGGGGGGNSSGTFAGDGGNGGNGIVLTSSTLTNNAGIDGGGAGFLSTMGGPQFASGGDGVVAITSTLTNDGAITGGTGIFGGAGVYGKDAVLTNTAAITGGAVVGAFSADGGIGVDIKSSLLTNDGTIAGGYGSFAGAGVSATGGSVTNNGTIVGAYALGYGGAGVSITNSTLTNNGLIIGGNANELGTAGDGAEISSTILTNNGSIIGGSDAEQHGTAGIGALFTGGGTLKDTGFISGGTYAGIIADAVNFGTGTSRLTLHAGASFDGDVVTEGSIATLELASAGGTGTITDIGSSFAGFGTITVDPDATWVAEGSVTGSGTFDLGSVSRLTLNGSVDATSPVHFTAASGRLGLGDSAGFAATVYGFQPGDAIDFTSIASTGSIAAGVNGSNDLTLTSGGILLAEIKLNPAQDFGSDAFHSAPDGGTGTVVTETAAPICFLPGTMIATPSGETPIEHLTVGDLVVTARRAVRPIVWIGTGRVLATRGRRSDATPVIVRKGALADNVPCRDLRVTKAHAVGVAGVLIPVEFLVNHRSILWDDHAQEVLLYHIELESHDVLLANGAPAESYRDDGNRWLFHNANSGWDLPAQPPCAPVLTGGPVVDAAWLRLLQRSGPRRALPLTDDPDLHLLVDRRRVDAVERHGEWQSFELGGWPEAVRIVSRSAVPQELGLARDPRCLGVALRQIMLRQGTRVRTIAAADATLVDGFHKFEPGDAIRWTNGDAAIAATLLEGFTGRLELMLCLGGKTRYLVESEQWRAA